jgi:hypothetical protein
MAQLDLFDQSLVSALNDPRTHLAGCRWYARAKDELSPWRGVPIALLMREGLNER